MNAESAYNTIRRGLALHRAGDTKAAEALAQHVLKSRRNDGNAMALMGRIAFDQGRYDEAVTWHRKSVTTDRKSVTFRCNLANSQVALGRFGEAIAAFERALKLRPDYPAAVAGLADVLERRGRGERARRLLKPHIDRGKATGKMLVVFARTEHNLGNHEAVVQLAEAAAVDNDLETDVRGTLLLHAGRCLDALGDYDRAFDCMRRGQELLTCPFDITETIARHDRLIKIFSADAMKTLPRASHGSELPVFIVGMPRTGSTLIEQILHAHPQAHGAGELNDLGNVVRAIPETIEGAAPYPTCVEQLAGDDLNRVANQYIDRVRRYNRRALRIVDKALHNFDRLGMIALLFPNARVIHARRNPLDTCLACFLQRLQLHPYASDLRQCGLYYREYHRLMEHWRRELDIRILDVEYEELVRDQEAVSRQIVDFCDLPWDEKCLSFHETTRDITTLSYQQVRQPIYTTAVSRHTRYEAHLGPLREALGDLARPPPG